MWVGDLLHRVFTKGSKQRTQSSVSLFPSTGGIRGFPDADVAKFSVKVHGEAAKGAQAHGGGAGRALGSPFSKGWVYLLWLSSNAAWTSGWQVGVGEWEEVFGALGALGVEGFLTCLKLQNFTYGF